MILKIDSQYFERLPRALFSQRLVRNGRPLFLAGVNFRRPVLYILVRKYNIFLYFLHNNVKCHLFDTFFVL